MWYITFSDVGGDVGWARALGPGPGPGPWARARALALGPGPGPWALGPGPGQSKSQIGLRLEKKCSGCPVRSDRSVSTSHYDRTDSRLT